MGDRKQHWEDVYREKSPLEVSWYQKRPLLSLELIHASGISPDEALIDVGGGASLLVDELQSAGFSRLAVLDISASALAGSRERLGAAANTITWLESDITQFSPPQNYTLWHDRAVFHFLTDEDDRKRYLAVLDQALCPGGHLIMAAFAIGGPKQCSGLDIVQYDAAKLGKVLGNSYRLQEERSEEHHTPAGKMQLFGYYRYIKQG